MKLLRLFVAFLWTALSSCTTAYAVPEQPVEPRVTLELNEGFCPNGALGPLVPAAGDPRSLHSWGSYCGGRPQTPLDAKTSSFIAPEYFAIYLTGFSESPILSLQRVSDGSKFVLAPWTSLSYWTRYDYRVPRDWQGKLVRLVLEDTSARGLWKAFSEPLKSDGEPPMGDALTILSLTLLHFLAIMLCAATLTALAIQRGVRDVVNAGVIALAAMALPGYFSFWLTLLSPRLAHYVAVLTIAVAVAGLVLCIRRLDGEGRSVLKALLAPVLLIGGVALLVLSAGFLYGGWNDPLTAARVRFPHSLPPDNELPFTLAQGAQMGHIPKPLFGDWLSSDRPPLESGIVLSQFPMFRKPHREQAYTVVGALAQSFWIFALWLLLSAFRLKSRAIVLALTACLFSGFVFLNTFFVWPKLLAAAYTLGFLAAFVARRPKEDSALQSWIAPGALLSFGLLSHGGTVFTLIPMLPLILWFTRPWQIKRMTAAVSFAFILYLPWTFYQKFSDPPGDRLLKYHLAGVEEVDNRSFLEAAKASYGALSFRQIVTYKTANFEMALGGGWQNLENTGVLLKELVSAGGAAVAAPHVLAVRSNMFFRMAACLGFFILTPYALLAGIARRFRSVEWRAACAFWILTLASIGVWSLLMFTPGSTSIHQGAYATVLLAMAAAVLSLWALSPRLALIVTVLQIGLNVLIYGPLTRVPYVGGVLVDGIVHVDTLLLCFFSLSGVGALLWMLVQRESFSIAAAPAMVPIAVSSS
jgi:hypothetical protein